MNYRKFGKTGFETSILGFGCMRFETTDNAPFSTKIIEDKAISQLRYAIDNGLNYIDTAYPYHGGQSEVVVGKALKDGYRDKVKIASKSPVWSIDKPGDFDKYLDEQLKRLNTDHIDFYLLHALNKSHWKDKVLKHDIINRAELAKKSGKIGHIGFSFHDEFDLFKEIVDAYEWGFCLLQLNYLNEDYQAGLKGYNLAVEKGMGIAVMEPLFGGKLANVPNSIKEMLNEGSPEKSPVEWALDYLWNLPGISVVLSGMGSMEQVKDNISYASRATANMFSPKESETIKKVQDAFASMPTIPCTKCSYCMPCPVEVDIPRNFELYNESIMFDMLDQVKESYLNLKNANENSVAESCISCKKCESVCPQNINIADLMREVHTKLG